MNDRRDIAMQNAVDLALSGQCSNWWTVQARMRASGCEVADLEWTDVQRNWLDRLCAQARPWPAAPPVGRLRSAAASARAGPDDGGNT